MISEEPFTTESQRHRELQFLILSLSLASVVNLSGMPDVHHIAVLNDVIFAFESQCAFGARVGFGTGFEKLILADGLCADEVFFQVGVNRPGGFLRARLSRNLPGAALVFARCEKRNQAQQFVSGPNQPHEAALSESIAGKKFRRIRVAHLGKFGFYLAADRSCRGIWPRSDFG